MRLVAVFSAGFLGGSELFNLEFLRTAQAHGVRIDAIVPEDGALAEALVPIAEDIEIVPIPRALTELSRFDRRVGSGALAAVLAARAYLRALRSAIDRRPGAVCCLGFRAQLAVAATGLAKRRRTGWIVHEVVPTGPYARLWRLASRRCDAIYTYSHAAGAQDALRDRRVEVRDVRFDLSSLGAAPFPQAPPVCLGLVGDLFELKNHLGLIEVVRRLRDDGRNVSGLLVGRDTSATSPKTAAYAADVRQSLAALDGAVRLEAAQPEEMADRFAEMDLLLHLSSVPESFGRVCVEAMAAGRPVVAFDHGAVADLIVNEQTGLLVAPNDLSAVVHGVERLADRPDEFTRMSVAARRTALERWSDQIEGSTIGDALVGFASTSDQRAASSRI